MRFTKDELHVTTHDTTRRVPFRYSPTLCHGFGEIRGEFKNYTETREDLEETHLDDYLKPKTPDEPVTWNSTRDIYGDDDSGRHGMLETLHTRRPYDMITYYSNIPPPECACVERRRRISHAKNGHYRDTK